MSAFLINVLICRRMCMQKKQCCGNWLTEVAFFFTSEYFVCRHSQASCALGVSVKECALQTAYSHSCLCDEKGQQTKRCIS